MITTDFNKYPSNLHYIYGGITVLESGAVKANEAYASKEAFAFIHVLFDENEKLKKVAEAARNLADALFEDPNGWQPQHDDLLDALGKV